MQRVRDTFPGEKLHSANSDCESPGATSDEEHDPVGHEQVVDEVVGQWFFELRIM